MRLAAIQHDIVWEDRDATLAHLEPQLARAAGGGARLIVLTEMFATGFSMRTHLTAEPIDGPTVTWMRQQAAHLDVWIAGSVPIADVDARDADPDGADAELLPTNALLLIGPDGTMHRYDKVHPFTYAGEHERFRPGDGPVVVELEGVRIGLAVCYDLRFGYVHWDRPDDVHLELIVANWPEARRHHWRTLLHARAIEDQVYVCGVNRVGMAGDKLNHVGDSMIIDPAGDVLVAAAKDETILFADIDPDLVAANRTRFPFRQDRLR
jgi:predicted amidohydrolase